MSFREHVGKAFSSHNIMAVALAKIATGFAPGVMLDAAATQRIALDALRDCGLDAETVLKISAEMAPAHERLRQRA